MDNTEYFLEKLFAWCVGLNYRMEFRLVKPDWMDDPRKIHRNCFPIDKTDFSFLADRIKRVKDRNVYVGVNPRDWNGYGNDSIKISKWLYADLDAHDRSMDYCIDILQRANIPAPDMIVKSGHGVHAYWELQEPFHIDKSEDALKFRNALVSLITVINMTDRSTPIADKACKDLARILRCPGTYNVKSKENPIYCDICMTNDVAWHYTLHEWLDNLKIYLPQETPKRHDFHIDINYDHVNSKDIVKTKYMKWMTTPTRPGYRHNDLISHAIGMAIDGVDPYEIRKTLDMKRSVSQFDNPISDTEMGNIIDWVMKNKP